MASSAGPQGAENPIYPEDFQLSGRRRTAFCPFHFPPSGWEMFPKGFSWAQIGLGFPRNGSACRLLLPPPLVPVSLLVLLLPEPKHPKKWNRQSNSNCGLQLFSIRNKKGPEETRLSSYLLPVFAL